jgi:hypothetical protein
MIGDEIGIFPGIRHDACIRLAESKVSEQMCRGLAHRPGMIALTVIVEIALAQQLRPLWVERHRRFPVIVLPLLTVIAINRRKQTRVLWCCQCQIKASASLVDKRGVPEPLSPPVHCDGIARIIPEHGIPDQVVPLGSVIPVTTYWQAIEIPLEP